MRRWFPTVARVTAVAAAVILTVLADWCWHVDDTSVYNGFSAVAAAAASTAAFLSTVVGTICSIEVRLIGSYKFTQLDCV